MTLLRALLPVLLLACLPSPGSAAPPAKPPMLMAHYMPWFEAKPTSKGWGWHWTMNHFHPDTVTAGRREAASHFYPLMGLYDSGDPDALDCHVLLMKMAGIDGVLIDWYGTDDYLDYGLLHRNTLAMVKAVKKAKLCYAVVYEDQTLPKLIAGHVITEADAVPHGKKLMAWVQANWFSDPAYLTQDGRPVFLVFGGGHYTPDQWTQMFAGLPRPPLFFTEEQRRAPADGAFAWPQPQGGAASSYLALDRFYADAPNWPYSIPAAWPRFEDVYAQAGVQPGYGVIDDRAGLTYAETLERALKSRATVVQLVTWNDWGEGTQIEPSAEAGYRDLETTQRERRRLDPNFPYAAADLRLPVALYALQKEAGADPAKRAKLETISRLLFAGRLGRARTLLAALSPAGAQTLTYSTSWVGNTFGGEVVPGLPYHKHVQISADDVFVAPDGTVYTDTGWDENGYEAGFYRDGDVRGALEELSHGWGRAGGGAVTASDKYVYAAMTQSGDDGANKDLNANGLRQYPDPKNIWYCVRRFTRDGRPAPFPSGLGWKNDMLLVSPAEQDAPGGHYPDLAVKGLAADVRRLYVSDPAHDRVRVFDAETLAPLTSWPCERPGKLALGTAGRLWVLQSGAGPLRRLLSLDTRTGALQPRQIAGPAGWDPEGIAADPLGHVLVADSGPDQNVKIYSVHSPPSRARAQMRPFGVRNGVLAAPLGLIGARRLNMPVGVGLDRSGNITVYSRGAAAGGGSVIEGYARSGARLWRLLGLEFIDCAEPDPASEADLYTKEEHFVMDYARPAGRQWDYRGYTVNRFRYPDDPRLHTGATSVFVRRIQGRRFLFTTDMYSSAFAVYRFQPATDGETAVPSVLFAKGHYRPEDKSLWPAAQPDKGEWLWRDLDGDGKMKAGEFAQPGTGKDALEGWGWSVDSLGDVWQASDRNGLREFPCLGLDAHGSPLYSYASLKTAPMPAPFVELCRAEYRPEMDTMFLSGYTSERPHAGGEWGTVGTEIVRYDHWSQGSPKAALRIALPYDGKRDAQVYIKAMCVAGNFVFAAESRDPERVFVYDARTGALQGTMQPDAAVGKSSGWVDTPYGIRAARRASGEYLVFVEEDLDAKVLLYRWTPPQPAAR